MADCLDIEEFQDVALVGFLHQSWLQSHCNITTWSPEIIDALQHLHVLAEDINGVEYLIMHVSNKVKVASIHRVTNSTHEQKIDNIDGDVIP